MPGLFTRAGARSLVERAARNRVLTRRLPEQFGSRPLVVTPDAALRWLLPNPWARETELLEAIELLVKPGMTVWDVGANVGTFGLPAAARSRATVLMIEADPFLAHVLQQSLRRNPDLDLRVLCAAVSAGNGVASFSVATRGRSASGLEGVELSTQHGGARVRLDVPTLPLDMLLDHFAAPGLLKVDVEGAELLVIAGARRLISEVRPLIYIEAQLSTRAELFQQLASYNYRVAQFVGRRWHQARVEDPVSENFIAVPNEREDLHSLAPPGS